MVKYKAYWYRLSTGCDRGQPGRMALLHLHQQWWQLGDSDPLSARRFI